MKDKLMRKKIKLQDAFGNIRDLLYLNVEIFLTIIFLIKQKSIKFRRKIEF